MHSDRLGTNSTAFTLQGEKVTKLSFHKCTLGNLSLLSELDDLEYLQLSECINVDYASLSNLSNLKILYLDNNWEFEQDTLSGLTSDEDKGYTYGYSHALSLDFLTKLVDLYRLEIYNSHILSLNPIASLVKLEKLYLCNNRIRDISQLSHLTKLRELDLTHNEIQDAKALIGLSNLRYLKLSQNNIKIIPIEFGLLSYLDELDFYENPVSNIPVPIIEQGQKSILSYLRGQFQQLWLSKMVLVGEGKVGKSSLLAALLAEKFVENRETTHGMTVASMELPHPDQDCKMQLNVWDFGGQEIYHATHQFYLTNHSLFILVWNARIGYEAGMLFRWLEVIKALAPNSPVFVVATETASRGSDLPKANLINAFKGDITFIDVDSKSGKGLAVLQQAIIKKACHLEYMGVERPVSWINAIRQIKLLGELFISRDGIIDIFEKCEVPRKNHEGLLLYMHDMGDILYYPQDDELKNTIILNPIWVSKQVAKILDSEELSVNSGWLKKDLLRKLWQGMDEWLQNKLVRLMENFDLSYKTQDDVKISLVVEKLNYEEDPNCQKIWQSKNGEKEIVFRYKLDTIPPGIPTWFIARAHRFSINIHWKYGVLLQDEGHQHTGIVYALPEKKEVWLKVRGNNPYYFFTLLRDTLELTFNKFVGLRYTISVPCPGHEGMPCAHYFDLRQLEGRLSRENPKEEIECPEGEANGFNDVNINVYSLILGLSFAPRNSKLVDELTKRITEVIHEDGEKTRTEMEQKTTDLQKFVQLEFLKSY